MSEVANNSRPHKPIIGLLGGIGSGKSTVSRLMASMGCGVIDADVIAKQALKDDGVRTAIRRDLGDGVFDSNGNVDRAAMASLVFSDPAKLALLESITHPYVHAVRRAARAKMQADPAIVAIVEDCPLLLEKQLEGDVDVLVFVDAMPEVRLRRVNESRGWDEKQLNERQNKQLGLDIKAKRAQYTVENNATEAHCLNQVRRVLSQILEAQDRRPQQG